MGDDPVGRAKGSIPVDGHVDDLVIPVTPAGTVPDPDRGLVAQRGRPGEQARCRNVNGPV